MSEDPSGKPTVDKPLLDKPLFGKGDRAAIVAGRAGVGVRGSVFWVGENKYGPGMRYGLRSDDGETFWVDETQIGREEDAPPPPPRAPRDDSAIALEKGARVEITGGPSVGVRGEVFWTGASRYGNGMRYGVRSEDGESHWVDSHQVRVDPNASNARGGERSPGGERASGPPPASHRAPPRGPRPGGASSSASVADKGVPHSAMIDSGGAPFEEPSELPPEAFDDEDLPPEAYEDDIPF